eukprot:1136405-Pelagomonas_calceolata.AAC.2
MHAQHEMLPKASTAWHPARFDWRELEAGSLRVCYMHAWLGVSHTGWGPACSPGNCARLPFTQLDSAQTSAHLIWHVFYASMPMLMYHSPRPGAHSSQTFILAE